MPPIPIAVASPAEVAAWSAHFGNDQLTAYEILAISHDTARNDPDIGATIEARYKALARAFHPDRAPPNEPAATREARTAVMQKINEAVATLRPPLRRRVYDITIGLDMEHGDGRHGAPGSINAALLRGAYGNVLRAVSRVRGFHLQLPKIVVVGYESSGKSSLLERVAFRSAFPRGEGFTTRMPIIMSLRFRAHEHVITLKHFSLANGQRRVLETLAIEPSDLHAGVMQDVVDVGHIAVAMQNFITRMHPDDDGESVLTDQEIVIEIRAPNVPDLDLVDLPGIVATPAHVRQQTLDCTRRYLRDSNTLVLCVLSAGAETLRGSPMLTEMDVAAAQIAGLWERTILILSKVDVYPGRLAQRLVPGAGELVGIPARMLVPVINRGQAETISMHDALERERAYFRDWCVANPGSAAADMGIDGVLRHLSRLIDAHIVSVWVPAEVRSLVERQAEATRELAQLGSDPSTLSAVELMIAMTVALHGSLRDFITEQATSFAAHELAFTMSQLTPSEQQLCLAILGPGGEGLNSFGPGPGGSLHFVGAVHPSLRRARDFMVHRLSLERFLSGDQLYALVVRSVKSIVSRAMETDGLPLRPRRFGNLKMQLLARVDASAALAVSATTLADTIRARGMLPADAPLHDVEGRQAALKEMVLQECVLPFFAFGGELMRTAGLANATQEDDDVARSRRAQNERMAAIGDAINVLNQLKEQA